MYVLFDFCEMQKLHMLAEIGIFTLNKLIHGGISKLQTPGQILLPSSLYRVSLLKSNVSFLEDALDRRFRYFLIYLFLACTISCLPYS